MIDPPNNKQAEMGMQGDPQISEDKEEDSADEEEKHVVFTERADRRTELTSPQTFSTSVEDSARPRERSPDLQRSGHEGRNDRTGRPIGLTASIDGVSGSFQAGLTDGQQRERTADTPSEPLHSSTESSTMLQEILDHLKVTTKALNVLEESSRKGAQEIKDLTRETEQTKLLLQDLASERKQTNLLLQALVQNKGKLSHVGSDDERERAGDLPYSSRGGMTNSWDLNINNKECYNPEFHYPDDSKMLVTLKTVGDLINAIEEGMQPQSKEEPMDFEHAKFLRHPLNQYCNNPSGKPEEVPEKSSKQRTGLHTDNKRQNGESGRGSHHESARNWTTENPSHNSLRQTTPQQASYQSRTTKEETESSHSEEDETPTFPVNMSKTRTPGSSSSTQDVRPKESTRGSRRRNRISGEVFAVECNTASESHRLDEALARARAPDPNPPSKARSYDTVLCLDTSESMLQGDAYQQMIEVANRFIDGVEDMTSDVEENIALVTFGGRADIAQHLTNDFSLVRQAVKNIEFGGSSPFYEAMVVCLAAFDGKGGTVSVSGEYEVHPRIIFITDGHITEGSDDPMDRVIDATNTRARFSRLMMDLNPKKDPSMPHPIIFVPVGSRTDLVFLKSMAELNDGQLIEPENLTSICNYYKIQETIGKVIVCMRKVDTQDISDQQIQNVAMALASNINDEEMVVVTAGVSKELKDPNRRRGHDHRSSFDDVFEDADAVALNERLPLGTRVTRGPDWRWGNQDRNRAGTVIQHEDRKHGFTWVMWDGGHRNRYPYGSEMGFHVWKTTDHPVPRSQHGKLQIGMIVRKGPNWHDPKTKNDGETGSVIRLAKDGSKVKVRWRNGVIEACSVNEVEFSDPYEHSGDSGGNEKENPREPDPEEEEEEEDDESKVPVWQWRDDWGNWRLYSRQEIQRLEAAYKRKRNGTCVLQRGNKQVRILFQRKTEKDVDKHTERDIQRLLLPEQELKSLEVAEELVSSQ